MSRTSATGGAGPLPAPACDAAAGAATEEELHGQQASGAGRAMTAALSTDVATLPELLRTRAHELGDASFVRDEGRGVVLRRVRAPRQPKLPAACGRWVSAAATSSASCCRTARNTSRRGGRILWLGGDLQSGEPGADRARGGGHPLDSGASVVICEPSTATAALDERRASCRRCARSWSSTAKRPIRCRPFAADPVDRARGGRLGRPARCARLHVRDDRPAEGRDALARQLHRRTSWHARASCCRSAAATSWGWSCRCSTSTRRWSRP